MRMRLLIVMALLTAAGMVRADWPQFLGPNRDGIAPNETGLARSWPADGPKVLWTVSVGSGGEITPELCPHAETVLRLASTEDEQPGVRQWCCPVYDHLLVFRRERLAA